MRWKLPNISEHTAKQVDVWSKIITTAFVVVGGTLAAISYASNRNDSIRNAGIEARKPIFEKQLEACLTGIDLANTIARSPANTEEGQKARKDFEKLFRGAITIVADNDVYAPASNLSDCLLFNCPDTATKAYNLGEGCRKSLNDKWSTRLHAPGPPTGVSVRVQ